MPTNGAFSFITDETDVGMRLDSVLAKYLEGYSRSFLSVLISDGHIRVGGMLKKSGYRLDAGEAIEGEIPPPKPVEFLPEPIDLDILHEDTDLIVVNKPPGLVVHPAPGHSSGTLVNGLLFHCPDIQGIGTALRPGIVHRLDKDTSGLLVVAKNSTTHTELSRQFKQRLVTKKYLALVQGTPPEEAGCIDLPIGRHPVDRKRMSTRSRKGRTAVTHWKILERLPASAFLEIGLETGRTHQIRVHCQFMGHPIIGDTLYARQRSMKRLCSQLRLPGDLTGLLLATPRQMLHAWSLSFRHPVSGKLIQFKADPPADMRQLLKVLRRFQG
jgi:23S rRNA pseudouridine1911/1915/1917 synthase